MKESGKQLEQFIEKVMKETSLETPPFDFTSKIMAQVAVLEPKNVNNYSPLISKKVWFALGIFIALMLFYLFTSETEESVAYQKFGALLSNFLPTIALPQTTSYSILIIAFMALIQISILKNYFDKKFRA